MTEQVALKAQSSLPTPGALLELLKPITWFPPMWAFACGAVSSPVSFMDRWDVILLGILLAGPLVCGTSQVVNDWFDRHVDAINEPGRPIPSGRVPGRWGLYMALVWTVLSLVVAYSLGVWVFSAACIGMALAWAYSAPPFRLKRNGWWGNSAVGACYEGLPWFTGAAVMAATLPDTKIILIAALYSIGAHGIMTLNDFKSIDGDRQMGLKSLPAMLGTDKAARLACWVMGIPQVVVIGLLIYWGAPLFGALVAAVLTVQIYLMFQLLESPREKAPWYNATGISLYVSGMMASAFALQNLLDGGL
ncbi:MAG TPA: chlorophyll synthase ChlG [Rhodospirillaceae bacterium]|nr:bacteriochlorophyll/chlorophyll a synthase [Rhodospirillaceae bacterium]MBB59445.1 bacteriochlorophyll/chlorophyll a synthase [Rhodospirillaceae bacterium]HAJ18841.1 chlorophyll synthase ChlG [Rhodospirillaceae bacterium]HBM14659.1 chlorophyll synthase ChlG [Rhodospirillaceae bacterium]|tara:strand:+ start:30829 stop:31743 length:915 start_codon:yes stop_codon:yes gene_type:complete